MGKPLYRQVILDLEKQIKNMKPNAKLPSERQLLVKYGVSRNTVRLALLDLEERGLIYRLHGKGTFVSSTFLNQPNIGGMYSFSEELKRTGQKASTKNQSLDLIIPDKNIAAQLNLGPTEKYNQISVMAFEDVEAVCLNSEESKNLAEEVGAPSLKIFRKTINDKNVPVEFTISLARGDKFVYRSRQYNDLS